MCIPELMDRPGGVARSFAYLATSTGVDEALERSEGPMATGNVRVIYPRKKVDSSPIGCHVDFSSNTFGIVCCDDTGNIR